jgi:hypothetical protein
MMRDHELIDELLAVRALDGLEGDDLALLEREMAAHGDCEECRRLEAAHMEVAGLLPSALALRPLPDDMVDRILGEPGRSRPTVTGPGDEIAARRDRRLRGWQAAFGVAAAIALLLAIVLVSRTGESDVVPGQRFVTFDGADGELAMAYTPGRRGMVIWGTGLPDPGAGKVYEIWLFEDRDPIRGGCLEATDGSIAAYLDSDVGETELLAVTVESQACPDAPTTDPVFTAELS